MAGAPIEPGWLDTLKEHWQAIVITLFAGLGWTSKRIVDRNDKDNEIRDNLIHELSRNYVELEKRVLTLEISHSMCPTCPQSTHHEVSK